MNKLEKAIEDQKNMSARDYDMMRYHLSCVTGQNISIVFNAGEPSIE
jgi:hypothetical protein